MKNIESKIQIACVSWFRLQYPKVKLFAIPNGGNRNAITGAIMKKEGVLAGVADLLVLKASKGYHGLFIEMKAPKGRQQDSQKEFETYCIEHHYKYIVCYSLEQFINEVKKYLC